MKFSRPIWCTLFLPLLSLEAFSQMTFPRVTTETAPSCCGASFVVTNISRHVKLPAGAALTDAVKPGDDTDGVEGRPLNAFVSHLPAGDYTLDIDVVELENLPGHKKRWETISSGSQQLGGKLVLEKVGKVYHVTGVVHHDDDSINGPLSIVFAGGPGPLPATFSAIHVKDASGKGVACVEAKNLAQDVDPAALVIPKVTDPVIYTNPDAPLDKRVDDLIRRMSLQEKVGQMMNEGLSIPRLGVPSYNFHTEALHGVAQHDQKGIATVFPEPIGMAACWDPALIHAEADVISTEARALRNSHDPANAYVGLTVWSPNINIFRDPRWGRGEETYGEDPFLTSRNAVAFIEGLQGDDPHYLKLAACAKHFAAHSGPEATRFSFAVDPPLQDFYDTYLPQFEAAVREAHVESVMSAYDKLYGKPCSANPFLLQDILRKQWGFQGHVVSDCTAISQIWEGQKYVPTGVQAAAVALAAGCDLECGTTYSSLLEAVKQKLVTEAQIDTALRHTFATRFRLGMFDPPDRVPYTRIPASDNDTPAHRQLALKVAQESMVLLKNDGTLPLDKTKLKRVAVVGPNSWPTDVLYGNYNNSSSHPVTILEGIKNVLGNGVQVDFAEGCPRSLRPGQTPNAQEMADAVALAAKADAVIYVGGLDPKTLEGEVHDRQTLELPEVQTDMIRKLQATGKPLIVVNCSGGAISFPWAAQHVNAILQAWYPGEEGGTAVADVLTGDYNPGGRLPVTFYASDKDLPPYTDYAMTNRTYRYFTGTPQFPFGYGLSYTTFTYGTPRLDAAQIPATGSVRITVPVTNSGSRDGDEVVQVYARPPNADALHLIRRLCALQRVSLKAGETKNVELTLPAQQLRSYDLAQKKYVVCPGAYELQVGASSSDIRHRTTLTIP